MTIVENSKKLLYVANEDFAFLMNRLPMARAARDAGFEVHVATRVDKGAQAIEAEGFILHRIPFRRGGLSPFAAMPTILAIRRLENKIQPALVHHSGLQCCVYGSIATLDKKTPLVNAITGLGYIFTSVNWRTRLLKGSLAAVLPRLLNRTRSFVLVQNPDDKDALETLGVDRKKIVLIAGSGVNTDVLKPLPEPAGPFTIGFAGRLLTDKGIRALVAAHGILRNRGLDIKLLIAGNPDPANPASVTLQEALDWGQRPGIKWLGHIENIVTLWSDCHVAVLPSHREGLPMSLLEAAACGRSMVATNAPGCREIVIEDETGLLVAIEDPVALANAIERLAHSSELRARYGHAARRLVEEKLSAKIIGKSIVELYERTALVVEPIAERHWSRSRDPNDLHESHIGKVVLVSQHYHPFPSTTAGYMTDIALGLALEQRVVVLSGAPHSASKAPWTTGAPEVIEIRNWWPSKSALVSRSIAAVVFAVQVFLAVLKHSRRGDAVLCVTTPFTSPYAVALAARIRRAAAAVIIYDFYPDTLVMAGFLRPSSLITRTLRWVNSLMFNSLAAIIVIGRDMKTIVMSYPKITADKIIFIPNWSTLPVRHREIVSENMFRSQCAGKFVVAMSGTAGFTHDPESVFEAARLLNSNTGIHFILSGEGVGWTKLKAMQANARLPNVTLLERVPSEHLEEFLSAADVWIIPYRKNNTGVSVPSRIYNLLAVGRPIIICSEDDAEAALMVREHDIGWVVRPEDPHALAQAISSAALAEGNAADKGRRAAAVAVRYTLPSGLAAYQQLVRRLLPARQDL